MRPVAPGSYGFVFQNAALLPWRTALENVLLPADILGLDRAQARSRALRLLDLVQLGHAAGQYPSELSGGMQQRVSIARALLHDPDILFMDEPFGALDAMTREQLNVQLHEIATSQHKTVLFVTHNIQESVLLSDRVFVFSGSPGRVVAEFRIDLGRPRTLRDQLSKPFRALEWKIRSTMDRFERQ